MKLRKTEINQLSHHLAVYGLFLEETADGYTLNDGKTVESVRFDENNVSSIYVGSRKVVELRPPYTEATLRRTARYINDYWKAVEK